MPIHAQTRKHSAYVDRDGVVQHIQLTDDKAEYFRKLNRIAKQKSRQKEKALGETLPLVHQNMRLILPVSIRSLYVHMFGLNALTNVSLDPCDKCDRTFAFKDKLKKHRDAHGSGAGRSNRSASGNDDADYV